MQSVTRGPLLNRIHGRYGHKGPTVVADEGHFGREVSGGGNACEVCGRGPSGATPPSTPGFRSAAPAMEPGVPSSRVSENTSQHGNKTKNKNTLQQAHGALHPHGGSLSEPVTYDHPGPQILNCPTKNVMLEFMFMFSISSVII